MFVSAASTITAGHRRRSARRSRSIGCSAPSASRRTGSPIPAPACGQRHSPLTQITPANVKNLELQWVFQAARSRSSRRRRWSWTASCTRCSRRTTSSRSTRRPGASSGSTRYSPSPLARLCCGRVNRGVAILGDTLFMGTIDGHLIAVDAKTGGLMWDVGGRANPKPATR